MTLFENLSTSYKYLMIVLKTILMKKLRMDYVMTQLMHKILKRKKEKSKVRMPS